MADFLYLTVQARRSERYGRALREDGEIYYTFYGDGSFLGRSAVDVNTKRALLCRLVALTDQASLSGWDQQAHSQLVGIGRQLFTLAVPDHVRDRAFDPRDPLPIALDVQDHDIPWELLHDGEAFLAQRHAFGRKVIGPAQNPRTGRHAVKVVVVGDPTGDLDGARDESQAVEARCRSVLNHLTEAYEIASEVVLLQGDEATKDAVLLDLLMDPAEPIDIFHFAGHAHSDPRNPDHSGLTLADSDLRAFEARSIGSTPLVFVNGCRAAQPADSSITFGAVSGIASEFVTGGAQGYIAPLWPVSDQVARNFAETFYDLVIGGETIGGALLATKRALDDPDALAYVFFGDVGERLPIFSPQLTTGPYVNDLGIHRIIETEREFHALELLAVNDLPWVLWDAEDILAWTSRIPIDQLRRGVVARSLLEYVQEFGRKIKAGEKRFVCILNASTLQSYLAHRGWGRWQALATELDKYLALSNVTLILAFPHKSEIEEIELVSKSAEIPPSPLESVYVFNKQTRFEQSHLTYNLFEDYNPEMISHYWERFGDLIRQSLTVYHGVDEAAILSTAGSATINAETRTMLHALAKEAFGDG